VHLAPDARIRVDRPGVSLRGQQETGWRPIAVFAWATVVTIVATLGLATVLFSNFRVG